MYGESPKALAGSISKKIGTMKAMPDWIMDGAVVCLQGGQDAIDETYGYLKGNNTPLAGIWLQDWVGTKSYDEGDRLSWNWQLNQDTYPNWDSMVQSWAGDGVKPMIYINPYVANLSGESYIR